jgi:hypothetical protein
MSNAVCRGCGNTGIGLDGGACACRRPLAPPTGSPGPIRLVRPKSPAGWQCPKCDRVYAPHVAGCGHCNPKES